VFKVKALAATIAGHLFAPARPYVNAAKGGRSGQGEFATSIGVAANTIANADFLATGL
jgi:hypothetical protein